MITFVHADVRESGTSSVVLQGLGLAVTAGDLIVVVVAVPSTTVTISSISTTLGSTGAWTLKASQTGADATAGSIWIYTAIATATGNCQVTVTVSSGGVTAIGSVFTGPSETLDGSAQKTSVSSWGAATEFWGSYTSTNASDVLIAAVSTNDTPGSFTAHAGSTPNAWSLANSTLAASSHMPLFVGYQILTSTQSLSPIYPVDTGNTIDHFTGVMVGFQEAVAPTVDAGAILIGAI